MKFKDFDIVLVNFPFTDLKDSKVRPALVIKSLGNRNYILCQITTKKKDFYEYEIPLQKRDCEGDIRFNSFVHVDIIFTLHEDIIISKIGSIKEDKIRKEAGKMLRDMFSY